MLKAELTTKEWDVLLDILEDLSNQGDKDSDFLYGRILEQLKDQTEKPKENRLSGSTRARLSDPGTVRNERREMAQTADDIFGTKGDIKGDIVMGNFDTVDKMDNSNVPGAVASGLENLEARLRKQFEKKPEDKKE